MALYPYQNKPSQKDESHKVISDGMKRAAARLKFSEDPVPGDLFDSVADMVARELNEAEGKYNKPTQIRRFYDELVRWQQRVQDNEDAFRKYEAFIRMMNAKVAYAKGRDLVDANFEHWFKEGIKATTTARSLRNFQLHFEAVLGFLKGLRD